MINVAKARRSISNSLASWIERIATRRIARSTSILAISQVLLVCTPLAKSAAQPSAIGKFLAQLADKPSICEPATLLTTLGVPPAEIAALPTCVDTAPAPMTLHSSVASFSNIYLEIGNWNTLTISVEGECQNIPRLIREVASHSDISAIPVKETRDLTEEPPLLHWEKFYAKGVKGWRTRFSKRLYVGIYAFSKEECINTVEIFEQYKYEREPID